jgi:hypothetical protein
VSVEAIGGWYDVSTHLAYDEEDGRFRIRGGASLLEGGQVRFIGEGESIYSLNAHPSTQPQQSNGTLKPH